MNPSRISRWVSDISRATIQKIKGSTLSDTRPLGCGEERPPLPPERSVFIVFRTRPRWWFNSHAPPAPCLYAQPMFLHFFFPRPTECEGKEKTFSFRWKTPPFSNLWSLAAIFRIPDFNVLFGRLSVVVFIYTPIIIKCWLFYFWGSFVFSFPLLSFGPFLEEEDSKERLSPVLAVLFGTFLHGQPWTWHTLSPS